jgi:membrane protein involved in colicin uptake
MNKRISCITPSHKTHRPVLRDISNKQPDKGQLLALAYNKERLDSLKEQLNIEATKRIEADTKRLEADAKRVEADAKRLEADAKRLEADAKRLEAEERAAKLEARLAALEGRL